MTCSLIVMATIILSITGILLNGIVRTFLHVWKKMPGLGKGLDNLSRVSLNHRVAPRRKRTPAKKSPVRAPHVLAKPAPAKQGVSHV